MPAGSTDPHQTRGTTAVRRTTHTRATFRTHSKAATPAPGPHTPEGSELEARRPPCRPPPALACKASVRSPSPDPQRSPRCESDSRPLEARAFSEAPPSQTSLPAHAPQKPLPAPGSPSRDHRRECTPRTPPRTKASHARTSTRARSTTSAMTPADAPPNSPRPVLASRSHQPRSQKPEAQPRLPIDPPEPPDLVQPIHRTQVQPQHAKRSARPVRRAERLR